MTKNYLLFAASLLLSLSAYAQGTDVTAQYITNPGFENSTPLEITDCKSYGTSLGQGFNLIAHWNTLGGNDYAESGWQLEEQLKNGNGGVVTYGGKVQYSNSGFESLPEAGMLNTSGNNAFCFTGNVGLIYKQPTAVTLPIGRYQITMSVYPYNGQYSHEAPTIDIKCTTGFIASDGTEFPAGLSTAKALNLNSNAWNEVTVTFEITEETTGNFQLSFGTQYFLVVDDIRLTYDNSIVTTALEKTVTRAEALNAELSNNSLATAITTAKAFIANPTAQSEVEPQVTALTTAMRTALAATTKAVNITAAYVDNASFETGTDNAWDGYGVVQEPINEFSLPYIDGKYIYDYVSGGSNTLFQTITDLPAGFYLLDAKINRDAILVMNNTKTTVTGGVEYVFLRVPAAVEELKNAGSLKIGSRGTKAYKADDFRLFYAKDEASLLAIELAEVKAVATQILNDSEFASVTGSERTTLATAIEGSDIAAINTAANKFVNASIAYPKLERAKRNAAAYTMKDYPYALKDYFDQIQKLIATEANTVDEALEMVNTIDSLCFKFYVSNFYCEGIEKTDYTSSLPTSVSAKDFAQRTDVTSWKNPKTGATYTSVLGVKKDYITTSKDNASYLQIRIPNEVPTGTFVMSVVMMGSKDLPIDACLSSASNKLGRTIGTIVANGTAAGGKYGAGWNDYAIEFTRGEGESYFWLYCMPTENYKEWYVANFRLYHLTNGSTEVKGVKQLEVPADGRYYDLQGRRVEKPSKGLYIINGKKVMVK